MNWDKFYGIRAYLGSSLWVVPFLAILLELIAIQPLHWLDQQLGWKPLGIAVPGAKVLLDTIITATLTFVVFSFGSLLIAIQIASAQLTPRIIATMLLRNRVVKYTVGLLVFTLLFAVGAENRIDKDVHQLVLLLAALFGVSSFAAFFFLIDYASRLLRPISILTHVGHNGLAIIESLYPDPSLGPYIPASESLERNPVTRTIAHQGVSGIVLAVNLQLLIAEAERSNGVIEFVPQVGDFVDVGEPLFNLHRVASSIDEAALLSSVAFGTERTMDQDPAFAFRIVVDIAIRALSPAINDPTTAVLGIDQLHRMLRMVGKRHLRTDDVLDKSGRLRVIFRTPDWEDFVHLSFSEIRACGSNNLQIVRRLRAMIENLIQTLPAHRHPALQQELSLLDREIERNFAYPEELALARIADSQGLGGHSRRR